MVRKIAIANQKGGVAKTVTSFNLAAGLARSGLSVCVVDMDPQSNITVYAGIELAEIKRSIFDLFIAGPMVLDAEYVASSILETHGFSLVPGSIKLAKVEKDIQYNKERRLEKILDLLPSFDVIVIDCPPSLGFHFINALTAATDLIIPIEPEPFAFEGIGQLRETIQEIREELNPGLHILGVLPTLVDQRTALHKQLIEELYKIFGRDTFKSYIRLNTDIAGSTAAHLPVYDYAPKSNGAEDYSGFVQEVVRRMNLG
jgi:chromosome partitioning protein